MPDDARLALLTRQPSAVVLMADVPGVLSTTEAEAADLMTEWVNSGAVELWPDHPAGPAVIASSATAAVLRLALVDVGGGLRWRSRFLRAKAERVAERVVVGTARGRRTVATEADAFNRDGPGLDGVADPRSREPSRGDVYSSVIVRLGVPWPGHADPSGVCPICLNRELRASEICIWPDCNRTGRDGHLTEVLPSERPTPAARLKRYTPDPRGLTGGRQKPKPKAKAKAKPTRKASRKAERQKARAWVNSFDLRALRERLEAG